MVGVPLLPASAPVTRRRVAVTLLVALVVGCTGGVAGPEAAAPEPAATAAPGPAATAGPAGEASLPASAPAPTAAPGPAEATPPARPAWLGTRPLPITEDGFGQILPTPPELVDRRLPPPAEILPAPVDGAFAATVSEVPSEVAARSTWQPACPVTLDELRYLTVAFYGFDDRVHTGELLVHADVADDVVEVFRRLFEARFPLEEVRIIRADELDLAPTGDGNTTTSFVCRPVRQGSSWSEHAYGRALDVNPFHNPYERGDVVLPELASAYLDRDRQRPGMVLPGGPATEAFAAIGWSWGGDWTSVTDSMHFSRDGG